MNTLRRTCALLAPLVLAACATTAPPSVPTPTWPDRWHAPLPHGGKVGDLASWWHRLEDPALVRLIEAAQAVNPDVASAAAHIAQARATRVGAGAALAPSLDLQASLQRGNSQPPTPLATVAQAGLQATWEIDLFGANRQGAQAAQARLEGAQAQWHEARVSVAAETAALYYHLHSCRAQLSVARHDATSRKETARLAELGAKAGLTAPATAALAQASAAEGSGRVTQQQAQCQLDLNALVALTGIAAPEMAFIIATPRINNALPATVSIAVLPAQVLSQRPDVYQAEREVAAAAAEVGVAQAQRLPRLSLSGSLTAGRVHTGGAGTDLQTWSLGPLALTLPLFDAGRRAANEDATHARYARAVALYQAKVRQAVREVEEALVNLASSAARGDDAHIAAKGYRLAFNATQARYQGGLASLFELEDARRTTLAAESALISLQREALQGWIALYRAAGGGWDRPGTPDTRLTERP